MCQHLSFFINDEKVELRAGSSKSELAKTSELAKISEISNNWIRIKKMFY